MNVPVWRITPGAAIVALAGTALGVATILPTRPGDRRRGFLAALLAIVIGLGAVAAPFRVVSATTLDGKDVTRTDVSYPEVPVRTSLKAFAFLDVARKMNSTGAHELCEKVN